jgi:hypothetical protein
MERDRSRDPDPERFDRDDIDWPSPREDPEREPSHSPHTPLDNEEDGKWLSRE